MSSSFHRSTDSTAYRSAMDDLAVVKSLDESELRLKRRESEPSRIDSSNTYRGMFDLHRLVCELLMFGRSRNVRNSRYYLNETTERFQILRPLVEVGNQQQPTVRLKNHRVASSGIFEEPIQSFLCTEKMQPVTFFKDTTASVLEVVDAKKWGYVARIPFDDCANELGPREVWVDIPIIHAGRVVGKLSCDTGAERFDRAALMSVEKFLLGSALYAQRIGQYVSGIMPKN